MKRRRSKRKAARAGLTYIDSLEKGIQRRPCGRGFTYIGSSGRTIGSKRVRKRIDALVIPPAWKDVVICKQPKGHLQAVGIDEAGRRQYIYHERWKAISAATKFDRMYLFGKHLPRIRRRILKDLNRPRLSRRRVLAAVFRLLDKTQLRVGNREYVESGAYGATTLKSDHVEVDKTRVSLNFPGKSGKERDVELVDPKVAKVMRECEEIEGQFLFRYLDESGDSHAITSSDVNDYLQTASGKDFTAKDFRTWWGCTIALAELETIPPDATGPQRKRGIVCAVEATAETLGNTTAVCRASYIHPGLLAAAESGELGDMLKDLPDRADRGLTNAETRFHRILPELDFC